MTAEPGQRSGPLDGVLVIDLSRHLPGPFASRMLANLGARVIKVEEPEAGDPVRGAPPFRSGVSHLAEGLLSGVESVALNLKKGGGRDVLEALLERADVVLETFRPGTLERLGWSPDALRSRWPRLVVCSLSGWGSSGPDASRAGHDLTYQAKSGALAATGEMPNIPTADMLGAWSAVTGVVAALLARERRGQGARVDASLFEASLVGNLTNLVEDDGKDESARSPGSLTGALPCYRLYRTRDGRQVALAALERVFWRRFCEAVERKDLTGDQYRRGQKAHSRVAELMASRTAAEWQELFERLDLPAETALSPAEALGEGQVAALELDQAGGGVPFPARIDGERPAAESGMPRLGEHTRAVLAEFCPRKLELPDRERLASGIGALPGLRRAIRGWAAALRR